MQTFKLQVGMYDSDTEGAVPVKELRVEFVPVQGTDQHQPVISFFNGASGTDISVKLPRANYKNLEVWLNKFVEKANPDEIEKSIRRFVAFLMLMK